MSVVWCGCHDCYAAELLQKSLSCWALGVGHWYQLKEKVQLIQQKTGFCVKKKSDGRTSCVRTDWTVIRMSVGRVVATTTGLAILVAIGTGGGTDAEDVQGLPWQVRQLFDGKTTLLLNC